MKTLARFMFVVMTLTFTAPSVYSTDLPDVTTGMHNGRPVVFIDGRPEPLPGYCPYYTKDFYDTYAARLFEDDFDLHFIALKSQPGDYGASRFWQGDTVSSTPPPDRESSVINLDEQAERILAARPDARIIVRFRHRQPDSWAELHGDELFIDEEGEAHDTPSLASDLFWEKAEEFCEAVVTYCESRPWGSNVIGYMNIHLAEGVHLPVAEGFLFDHGPRMREAWRGFLRDKYTTVERLREAYGDSSLTFETIGVPRDRLRGPVPDVMAMHYWQDARDNRGLRDYLELQRDLWHRRFSMICAGMERGADRSVLMLHDVFKQPMQGWNHHGFFGIGPMSTVSWNPSFPELMAGSGSMGVTELFGISGFDGIITPHDYQMRGLGGVYEPEGMADSAVLRGMFFMTEMDTRFCVNCREDGSQRLGGAHSAADWAAITWRNLAAGFTRGFGSYWHHSWTVSGDWFFDDDVHAVMERQIEVIRESIGWEHRDVPGIAMILDDTAVLETNGSGAYLNEAVMWEYKLGLARCGVPFRIYMLEDLALDDFPDHRVFYFPNMFRVDDERLALLREKVFRDGRVVVWGPGSGISDGTNIGAESASRLTGFDFRLLPANAQRRILISNFDHPVTAGLDPAMIIGGTLPYGPVLVPADGLELGRLSTKGGLNDAGMAFREFGKGARGNGDGPFGAGDYASIFMAAVQLPADLWRNIARYAGAHVWCGDNELILADESVVAMHSFRPGPKRIHLPERRRVTDLVRGEVVSAGATTIEFDMKAPETSVFLLEP